MIDVSTPYIISSPQQIFSLDTQPVAILDGYVGSLDREQERSLCTFVERGGGLVCLGDAVEAYHEYELLGELLGNVYGHCIPHCEIIARVATPDHYMTLRVDPAFVVREAMYLLDRAPADAQVLWRTSWHNVIRPLAYTRDHSQGRVFCTTLGNDALTRGHPVFKQMIERAIRYVSGEDIEERPAHVAMIGYGAIGFEHGTAVTHVPGLEYTLVCDRNEERLQRAVQAFPAVRTCRDASQVAEERDVDIVIISTPPDTHAALARQMLEAGKHVVVEKPFCLTTAEADELIELAQAQQRALTVYQCRRWDPDYLAIQRVLQQGTIGNVFYIETFIGGYAHPCEYWHSHEPISGGVFYDWGSHYLDWILNLIADPVVSVRGVEHKRVWHDVTNADQASVYLRFAGGQEATFIHSDIAAVPKPKWYILGERGAIIGNWRQESVKQRSWSGDLVEERLALSEALPDLKVFTRHDGDTIHEQHLQLPPMPLYAFHRNLANHLYHGEVLAVPPEEARRNIVVMEAAKQSALRGGETIPLLC